MNCKYSVNTNVIVNTLYNMHTLNTPKKVEVMNSKHISVLQLIMRSCPIVRGNLQR